MAGVQGRAIVKPIGRFVDKVKINNGTGCYEWTGSLTNFGHGKFSLRNKVYLAHRWIWMYVYQVCLGRWEFICHSCDNPACVNINHLYKGTAQTNMDDKVRRGRHRNQYT
jgi:hypothetical protein